MSETEPRPWQSNDEEESEVDGKAARRSILREAAAPVAVLAVFVIAAIAYIALHPKPEQDVRFSAVPLSIEHRVHEVRGQAVDLGYMVETAEWVVVSHADTMTDNPHVEDALRREVLHLSEHMASLCRLAKKHNDPVTFVGVPLGKTWNGKPVLLAKKMTYEGEDVILND